MVKFRSAFMISAALASLLGSTVSQAAVRPQVASLRAAPAPLSTNGVSRASTKTEASSHLVGVPLIFIAIGAAAVVAVTVAVATSGSSSPR
jgi:hypothetical protein